MASHDRRPNHLSEVRDMKGDHSCVDGRLMRYDPQPDDPYLQTDLGECPDCDGLGCERPKVLGISRRVDNSRVVLVSFSTTLADDEMRDFHEYLREWER